MKGSFCHEKKKLCDTVKSCNYLFWVNIMKFRLSQKCKIFWLFLAFLRLYLTILSSEFNIIESYFSFVCKLIVITIVMLLGCHIQNIVSVWFSMFSFQQKHYFQLILDALTAWKLCFAWRTNIFCFTKGKDVKIELYVDALCHSLAQPI